MWPFGKKNKTMMEAQTREEQLEFEKARNRHLERKVETEQGIDAEREKRRQLQQELARRSTAGKIHAGVEKVLEGLGKSVNNDDFLFGKKKGNGGLI